MVCTVLRLPTSVRVVVLVIYALHVCRLKNVQTIFLLKFMTFYFDMLEAYVEIQNRQKVALTSVSNRHKFYIILSMFATDVAPRSVAVGAGLCHFFPFSYFGVLCPNSPAAFRAVSF